MQATFRGGTTFAEVNIILDKYGLAMSMLGSISNQRVAGAIATGSVWWTFGASLMFSKITYNSCCGLLFNYIVSSMIKMHSK